jgi:predicted nucleotidyltransferase
MRRLIGERDLIAGLCAIVEKTVAVAEPLRDALGPLVKQIKAAFVYGSVSKRQDTAASDIDLMVISDVLSYGDIFSQLERSSARLGRTVNPTILSTKDLAKRVKDGDSS